MLVLSFINGFEQGASSLCPSALTLKHAGAGLTQQVVPNPREKAGLPPKRLSSGSQQPKDLKTAELTLPLACQQV